MRGRVRGMPFHLDGVLHAFFCLSLFYLVFLFHPVSLCLFLSVSVSLSGWLSPYLSLCSCPFLFSFYLTIILSICLSMYLPVSVFVSVSPDLILPLPPLRLSLFLLPLSLSLSFSPPRFILSLSSVMMSMGLRKKERIEFPCVITVPQHSVRLRIQNVLRESS